MRIINSKKVKIVFFNTILTSKEKQYGIDELIDYYSFIYDYIYKNKSESVKLLGRK